MAKQWVDITTLNNTTPFGKVRWKSSMNILDSSNTLEFSEVSGLTVDGRSWYQNAGAAYGYASTHRTANNDNSFTCTFLNEYRTSNDVTVSSVNSTAGTAVHDVSRSVYNDGSVIIDGKTFYEVDFTTWSGYTPLYYPYSGTAVSAGEVYVYIISDPIVVDKNRLSFKSSGETKNVVVVSDSAWTATTSEAWVTLSTSAGTSGETTLSVTAPEYTSTIEDRTATITITDGEFSVTIDVKQAKKREGGVSEMYLGTLNMEAAYFGDLEVEAIYLGDNEVYSSGSQPGPTPVDYSTKYLTMKANSAGNIVWMVGASGTPITISYSLDSGSTWSSITSTTNGVSIPVSAGDEVLFKGTNERYQTSGMEPSAYRNAFSITDCNVVVEGNIMSMIYGDNFENQTSLSSYALTNFFFRCSGITSVENLVLPATSLNTCCYEQMFYQCTGITKAPVLPATTLATMSYTSIFNGCTSLNYVKCLATNRSALNCTMHWLNNVAATGTFVKASGSTWSTGTDGIPSGWTVVEE